MWFIYSAGWADSLGCWLDKSPKLIGYIILLFCYLYSYIFELIHLSYRLFAKSLIGFGLYVYAYFSQENLSEFLTG